MSESARTAGLTLLLSALLGCRTAELEGAPVLASEEGVSFEPERNERGHWQAELFDGHVLIHVPAGEFAMGAADGEDFERPVHRVQLDDYWIGKYPVTEEQFAAFIDDSGHLTDAERGRGSWIEADGEIRYDASWRDPWDGGGERLPVVCVSWADATAYAAWLAQRSGLGFCLPTEAQWERAARGTDGRAYPWGDAPPDGSQANFADARYAARFPDGRDADARLDDGYAQRSPVDAFPAGQSPCGAFDMAGNTIDWLSDWYDDEYYQRSPLRNPSGPERQLTRHQFVIGGGWGSNLQRAIRGGAWTDATGVLSLEDGGHSIRSDRRESTDQHSSDDHLGFRLAIDPGRTRDGLAPGREEVRWPDGGASVSEWIGGAEVRFEYRRAQVAGREGRLFGQDVPHGEPWSIGAPTAALLSSQADLLIGGEPLAAGRYALSLVPEVLAAEGGEWTLLLHEWDGEPGAEVLRVRTRAQLEDNSKEDLEVFFDVDAEGGAIARILWEYVEVHISIARDGADEGSQHAQREARAAVMNSVGQRELAIEYTRQLARGAAVFGERVPYGEAWPPDGEARAELRGDLELAGVRVASGRYALSCTPRDSRLWVLTLEPLSARGPTYAVSVQAHAEVGEEHVERSEVYFDRAGEGQVSLVLVWGHTTLTLDVREPRLRASAPPVAEDELVQAVAAMEEFAEGVTLNEQGYPEAVFAEGTVLTYIPAGSFPMGSAQLTPDELPLHDVHLSGYWIGKYPVTNAQFARFVEATGFVTDTERPGAEGCYVYDFEELYFVPTPGRNWRDAFAQIVDDHPVACVSWYDGQAYAAWLAQELGIPIGMPTEAQWEKAARGTDGRIFPWGNEAPDATRANFCDRRFAEAYPDSQQGNPDRSIDDGYAATSPVDAYPAGQSPYGIFDLAGNLTEWVFDFYAPYPEGLVVDPLGPSVGEDRCMRCGIWVGDAGLTRESIDEKHNLRAESRSRDDPRSSDDHLGIRVTAALR